VPNHSAFGKRNDFTRGPFSSSRNALSFSITVQWTGIPAELDANSISFAYSLDKETHAQRSADHHGNRQGILGHRPCAQKSIKPQKEAVPVCCLEIHPVMKLEVQ
jgi:hypothetical protein